MSEVMANEDQKRLWRALAQGATSDWSQLFAGYASCIDWPSAYYWRDLIEFYPDARVILTYRSPESWWKSFEKTILAGISHSTDQEALCLALISRQVFGGRPHDRANAIAVYEANVRAVIATAPPGSAADPQSGRRVGAALPASWRASTGPVLSQSQQHQRLSVGSCTELV
ncbi:sulfotransferase family protein [Mesorhizobium caraganae]|uniref:sulfotransferase family protein n=1 Tax=Mesorhizobium caraganae TaxID=483206 RepID=UPI00406AB265